jgi:four helix bundle protein
MEIFEASKKFPSEEKFSLTDQIRRSSRSVCANMAEAWRKRRYEAAFISKLSDRDGEAAETEVHLAFALRCGYLSADKHAVLMDHYDHICRQLRKMMDDAPSWCESKMQLRESEEAAETEGLDLKSKKLEGSRVPRPNALVSYSRRPKRP